VKSPSVLPVLAALGLALARASVAHAEGGITGSVLRVDEGTYRIQFIAFWVPVLNEGCPGDPPSEDAYSYCNGADTFFAMSGDFGIPKDSSDCWWSEDGHGITCYGGSHVESQFEFEPPVGSSRLSLSWYVGGDYRCKWCFTTLCWPAVSCGGGSASGEVYAVLPTRVGDSTPLEPVVAVAAKPWGAVKQLYR